MMFQHKAVIVFIYTTIWLLSSKPQGCTKKNNALPSLSQITYRTTGGRGGNYEHLSIAPDSLLYTKAIRGNEKILRQRTAPELWKDLTATLDIADFDRVKSNPGHALYDGIDLTITVVNNGQTHTMVNGNEDSLNFKRIQPFVALIEKELDKLRPGLSE